MYTTKQITNKDQWEEFIKEKSGTTTCPTSFIQSWNWGEFLMKQGHKIHRLGFFENQKLIGLALGTKIKAKRGRYLHFRHAPIIDWKNIDLVHHVLDELKNLAKKESAWFVRVSPLITHEQSLCLHNHSKPSQMHDVDAEETWVLELDKSEKELLQEMRKNTRYNIKKAEKMGIEIIKTKDSKYLTNFWEIFQDTVKRQKWVAYPFNYIKDEFETFAKDDQNLLFLARYKGQFIAAAIFNYYNDQSVYHHSGSLTDFRKIPASYLIQWEAIKEAKARGMKVHNFWGLPLNNQSELDMHHPWSGLGLFKVGFGGKPQKFIHARDIPISWKYWFTHFYEKFETRKRGYK